MIRKVETGFPPRSCSTNETRPHPIQPETVALKHLRTTSPSRGPDMNKLRLSAFAFLFGLFAAPAMAQDITVALAGPMTSGQATFGRQMRNGAEQAIADFNAAGGVLGRKLRLEVGDDACDPKQARSVAEKLAGKQVAVVVGHYCSSSSIPASDAYLDGNILQITPASTNPLFTDRNMWNTFRTCGRDDQQGGFAAGYLAKHFQIGRAHV